MNILEIADVKLWLRIRDERHDSLIPEIINKAETFVFEELGGNYYDLLTKYGEIPAPIKCAALMATNDIISNRNIGDHYAIKQMLRPYKKHLAMEDEK